MASAILFTLRRVSEKLISVFEQSSNKVETFVGSLFLEKNFQRHYKILESRECKLHLEQTMCHLFICTWNLYDSRSITIVTFTLQNDMLDMDHHQFVAERGLLQVKRPRIASQPSQLSIWKLNQVAEPALSLEFQFPGSQSPHLLFLVMGQSGNREMR